MVIEDPWFDAHWHGCGLPVAQHVQERFGDRWVAFRPPYNAPPCFVRDNGPPPTISREEARERAVREREARKKGRA